ncbi:transposase [Neisseria dentiae]|uniref:Transposase n=1 Tax=Neisseria dentiae TaxID=194197 RepID=A0A1X3D9F0_9NEIS|nr:transposase [Neisseria dentiae]STZ49878.1 ORF B of IS150 [Neisseria dentiae]STZ49922.1 ORF B of IS150 [Neisseria dentiae]
MKLLLEIVGLPRSTFYYQLTVQSAEDKYADLKRHIHDIYRQHKGRYGYRRITAAIRHTGTQVNHKKISRLMTVMGLKAVIRRRKYRSFRGEVGKTAPNILQRHFKAGQPNEKWVTDVTEFDVGGEKVYLSPIMDLFNGEIVSYRIQTRPTFDLVGRMLKGALEKLRPSEKPILHSDQGWQYQMHAYQRQLKDSGLVQSMSRKGNCLDNAAMESFFGTLKSECFHTRKYDSAAELEAALHEYIRYYNHDRIKLKLKGLSPVRYRIQSLEAA